MSKVDWILAPLLATHAGEFNGEFTCWYWLGSDGIWRYSKGNMDLWERVTANKPIADLTERPAQVKQWSGPQDGLPPVGSRVEIVAEADEYAPDWDRYADHIGKTVTIIAHQEAKHSQPIAVYSSGDDGQYEYHSLIAKCFRAIRTQEQLAAEQRETAIREIMDIADVDCRVTAARLVDAGFKREVV
jgi:hypothetical protein